MINVFIYGASVTQQSKEGSYISEIKSLCDSDEYLNVRHKGYGGCHFNDAGYLTLDRDLNDDTNICFLEWNTTNQNSFDNVKLRYVLDLLYSKKVMPVFLILARESNVSSNRPAEEQVIQLCHENELLLLDYRHLVNVEEHLRDGVHTNALGGMLYANAIKNDLPKVISRYAVFRNTWESTNTCGPTLSINANASEPFELDEGEMVEFILEDVKEFAEVVLEVTIGPSSGLIEINETNKVNFWDQWCHFERPSFKQITLTDPQERGVLKIKMLEDKVDYSSCRRELNYTGIKTLKVNTVWSVNCVCVEPHKMIKPFKV